MQLTLIPSSSYPIPVILQTHDLPSPRLALDRNKVKTPNAYLKAKRLLGEVGLALSDHLAADRALWWQFAVEEVVWNLEEEEVVVSLSDGTEERWELDGEEEYKTPDLVEDSMEDELSQGSSRGADGVKQVQEEEARSGRPPRWAASTVLATLQDLSIKLRSAYEDLGTAAAQHPSAPSISSESDYRHLMLLSADPSRKVPYKWSVARTVFEYAMEGADESEEEKGKREPSQAVGAFALSCSPSSLLLMLFPQQTHLHVKGTVWTTRTASKANSAPAAVRLVSLP
jgi:hypothetical protein